MIAAFNPAHSSVAAVASRLSASAQYEVTGYGELRTWSGPPGERSLLALSQGVPAAGEVVTLRVALPASTKSEREPLEWDLSGFAPLEPLPSETTQAEAQVRVRTLRAKGRRVRVRLAGTALDLSVPDLP